MSRPRFTCSEWSASAEMAARLVYSMDKSSETAAIICGLAVEASETGKHVCLYLPAAADKTVNAFCVELRRADNDGDDEQADGDESPAVPSLDVILEELKKTPFCIGGPESDGTPFVLDGNRLYTRRNFGYEQNVVKWLVSHMSVSSDAVNGLEQLGLLNLNEQQQTAVRTMLNGKFSVLTGGPGTGKTYTIARALVVALQNNPDLRVGLAAPTGKAGARIGESIAAAKKMIGDDPSVPESIRNAAGKIPEDALTIHRLLAVNHSGGFKHNAENPLPLDWLIVDEASMIDLPLFANLTAALPADCRLTLAGDSNQLASVQPGKVFKDICTRAETKDSALCGSIVRLTESRRFKANGVIAGLSNAINDGKEETSLRLLRNTDEPRLIAWNEFNENNGGFPEKWQHFIESAESGYDGLISVKGNTPDDAAAALKALGNFCILCALRRGKFGSNSVNRVLTGLFRGKRAPQPVIVTSNHHELQVFNGDTGIILYGQPDMAWFPAKEKDAPPRPINIAQIPDLQPAWAITVHKSQGSEYENIAVILTDNGDSPLLTREILYTGITRTKKGVVIWGSESSLRSCISKQVFRWGGLSVK